MHTTDKRSMACASPRLARWCRTAGRTALSALLAFDTATPLPAAETRQVVRTEPPVDCPLRDAPFSVDSPLLDILLSQAASEMANKALEEKLATLPPFFVQTQAPTFAAILTLRNVASLSGISADVLPALYASLRTLPITSADKTARCVRYDNERPTLDLPAGKPHILLFEKINGFKDAPGFNAAHAAFLAIAARHGWTLVVTDRAGTFAPDILGKFDAVIWNNVSGDVLTLSQRKAFREYIERGGAYIGVHGSAGDPSYFWDWYTDTLLGARFTGHTMEPQFQQATIVAEGRDHPAATPLPASWTMKDEWYSFASSPRLTGSDIIARLDESTYSQKGRFGENLTMGDHPIAWTRRIGKGRMFYSAIGHLPETYSDPRYVAMLENAISWSISGRSDPPGTPETSAR